VTARDLDRFTLDVYLEGSQLSTMRDEVRAGLTAPQKSLPSKYFYDARGSELFEKITELPEYYQTRTELAILQSLAAPLADEHRWSEVVEIGSGSSKKTLTILDALNERGLLKRFVPIDVSESILRESARTLLQRYPELRVQGVIGDFMVHLGNVPPPQGRRLVIFLGSTIGNLDAPQRLEFLRSVRAMLGPEDHFLVGMDLVKDIAVVEAAYNDSQGVTAEFNRNVLRVVNRELNANFVPEAYRHLSFFNVVASRIEMHLVPDSPQKVVIRDLDLAIECLPEETIFTEISCKYTEASARAALVEAGLELAGWYSDPKQLFGVALAKPS
jgi:L-histidine N-alpha-methyltransferase